MKVNKNCLQCDDLMIDVHPSKKYCDCCARERRNDIQRRRNKTKPVRNFTDKMLRDNFYKVVQEDHHLTPKGFDEISEYNSSTYLGFYNTSWCEIMKLYDKGNELFDYIVNEFKAFLKDANSNSLKLFGRKHKYISDNLLNYYTYKKIFDLCKVRYLKRGYSIEELKNNFINIILKLNRVPLFMEFKQYSKISISTYMNILQLKGKVYNQIVKTFATEEQYNEYIKLRLEHKSKVGKQTGIMAGSLLTKEQLETELKYVFDEFYKEYNKYPNIHTFEKIIKRDKRTFEEKFGKKFKDICLDLGYDIEDKASAEYIVLTKISKILNEKCIRQKTWKWLRGINDFPLWVDGYFPIHNLVVEFDGRQHQEPVISFGGEKAFNTLQQNDEIKNKLIPENGIKLLRISVFEDWFNDDYLKQVLLDNEIIINYRQCASL